MDRYLKRPLEQTASALMEEARQPPPSKYKRAMDSANQRIFGNDSFRTRQEAIIQSVLENKDIFVVMPTGGGKSLCFQLPATLSPGVTIVVSPLLSLIEDQVSALIQLPSGGVPSAYLCSTCSPAMEKAIFQDLERSDKGLEPYLKLLYVTPERLVNNILVRDRLLALYNNEMLARFVIDEAHCVSSWGHDFRKDYKNLSFLKKDFPESPIVALTATARTKVMEDTLKVLGIKNTAVMFSAGFDRPNLYFEVRQKPTSTGETYRNILAYIMENNRQDETGIVYCMTKKDAELVSDFLRENDVKADFYHAGQTLAVRKLVQGAWSRGEIKVVCATIAYGMGIDKPNVRYVLHMSLAKSLEGYYQEAGRAGRDNQYSECIMYYRNSDVQAMMRIMMKPPARTVSKGDTERLEEMQEYCENMLECRRKTFARFFGSDSEQGDSFSACGKMCDNCVRKSGMKRRPPASAATMAELKPITLSGGGFRPAAQFLRDDKHGNARNSVASSSTADIITLCSDDDEGDAKISSFLSNTKVASGGKNSGRPLLIDPSSSSSRYNTNQNSVGKLQFVRASQLLASAKKK